MSGFLPQERQWFSDLLEDGWHDVFRKSMAKASRSTAGGPAEVKQEQKTVAGE